MIKTRKRTGPIKGSRRTPPQPEKRPAGEQAEEAARSRKKLPTP
jgi:hypothetical protein